jgi:hypothetical protein
MNAGPQPARRIDSPRTGISLFSFGNELDQENTVVNTISMT